MAKVWEQDKDLQASDGKVYFIIGLDQQTVTVNR
jgi:hypothetical protein